MKTKSYILNMVRIPLIILSFLATPVLNAQVYVIKQTNRSGGSQYKKIGQSFTTRNFGAITHVKVVSYITRSNVTLKIFKASNCSVIYQQSGITLNGTSNIALNSFPVVEGNSMYVFEFSCSQDLGFDQSTGNHYTGGGATWGGCNGSGSIDLVFEVQIDETEPKTEIEIKQGSTNIPDGGTFDFHGIKVGTIRDLTFTISNSSARPLTLSTPIAFQSGYDPEFTIVTQPAATTLQKNESTTFTIRFSPGSAASKTALLAIANNDPDENPFNITFNGSGGYPDIEIRKALSYTSSVLIPNGGTCDYGGINLYSYQQFQFYIKNFGSALLTISQPQLGGVNANEFRLITNPDGELLPGNTVTSFWVRFTPTSAGNKTAWISIANNTDDDNPYIFNLLGKGQDYEINLKQSTTDIPNNGTFNFSNTDLGAQTDAVITIENQGESTINLTITVPLSVSGTNADQFNIITQPSSSIPAGSNTTFTVRFVPTSEGSKSAIISIANNDRNENPYVLNINGMGIGYPDMTVWANNTLIDNGDDTPSSTDGTDFGTIATESSYIQVFTIKNTGNGTLNLTNSPRIAVSGDNPSDFIISTMPDSSVIPFTGTSNFQIKFQPTGNGHRNAVITIANNDADDNPYIFSVSGLGDNEINPYVTSYSPGNSEHCYLRPQLGLTFNEDVWAVDGKKISIYNNANILFEEIPVADPRVTISGNQIYITPDDSFTSNTEYYVLIDEGAFYDIVGDTYSGIQSSSIWRFTATVAEPPGRCLEFDGENDYASTSLTLPSSGTIEFWFYLNSVYSTYCLWSGGNNSWLMLYTAYSGFQCRIGQSSIATTSTLSANRWYHVAVTWQRTINTVNFSLYLNGTLINVVTDNSWVDPGSTLYIGSSDGLSYFLNGKIDEFRIWNGVRTITKIEDNMFKTITPTGDPLDYLSLLAYYRVDEFRGDVFYDELNNLHNCILHNMTDADWVRSLAPFGDYGKSVRTTLIPITAGADSKTITASSDHLNDDDFLGIYATGEGTNLVTDEDFGSSGVTQRRNLFWGAQEFGSTDADLTFDYSGLALSNSADLKLIKRDNAISPWQDITSTAVHDQVNHTFKLSGVTDFSQFAVGGTSLGLYDPDTIFVKHDAIGNNDGTSWSDAYTSLQVALDNAQSGDQMWVAAGTYKPETAIGGFGDRYKAFKMKNRIAIYGGFSGSENPASFDLDDRDFILNETILSGDLNDNGADNNDAYHVFNHTSGTTVNSTAMLDGFTISGGNANDPFINNTGGGMININSSPTLSNLKISGNTAAENGGGMYNYISSPVLSNVQISDNIATKDGGGIYNLISSPQFINVLVTDNVASRDGGGMYDNLSFSNLINATISGNTADQSGGGMYNVTSTTQIRNSIIWGNSSSVGGKQFYIKFGVSTLSYSCYSDEVGDVDTLIGFLIPDPTVITENPKFGYPDTSDYRLYNNSPCVDVGKNAFNSLATDIRGKGFGRKLYRKNENQAGTIDMGAYEFNFATDPKAPCINPTSGGEIAATPSSMCISQETIVFTAVLSPAGYSGDLEYQWQWSADNILFEDIQDATGENYTHEDNVFTTTWFRRLVRVDCDPNGWINATPSNVVELYIEQSALAGNLTKEPNVDTVCEGTLVSATLIPGSGGNNNDILQSRIFDGTSWSEWESYISGTPVPTEEITAIEIQTWRDADLCSESSVVSSTWVIEQTPTSGTITKIPDNATVCEGDLVSATFSAGSGGNGTDIQQVRINNGNGWSEWMDYMPGEPISTDTLVEIEIQSWREADYCDDAEATYASWEVKNTPITGDLSKTPNANYVCEGDLVSSILSPGFGGNGTDVIQMRTYDGDEWTIWQNYSSAEDIPTMGFEAIEIQTWRDDDDCNNAAIVMVGWTVAKDVDFTAGAIQTIGETICFNTLPQDIIGNAAEASGGDENFTYSWRSSVDNFANEIPGAVSQTYTPEDPLITTTAYRRFANNGTCNTTPEESVGTWTVTVQNEFNSGEIATTGETICYNTSPQQMIGSAIDASGGDENITYSWRSSVDNFANAIPGAIGQTYTPEGLLTVNTAFRRYAKDGTCNTSSEVSLGTWTITIEQIPAGGSLSKSPPEDVICQGSVVSATLTAGLGGNGTDVIEYRSHDGNQWSDWENYISGLEISTSGTMEVQIHTWREATSCEDSGVVTITWETELCCTNPNNAGSISENQNICSGTAPETIENEITPSGLTGILEYKWQWSTTSALAGFNNIANSDAASYSPGNLTTTTWFRRLARVTCVTDDWATAAITDAVKIYILGEEPIEEPWYSCNTHSSANGTSVYYPCEPGLSYKLSATGKSTTTNDVFHFVNKELCGNGTVIARLDEVENGGWGGVMMRESNLPGAKTILFKTRLYNPNVIISYRTTTGSAMRNLSQVAQLIRWMKIQRNVNNFKVFTSYNGTTWQQRYSGTINMGSCIQTGIFTESVLATRTSIAWFDNVEVVNILKSGDEFAGTETNEPGEGQFRVDIYPNPAEDLVTISIPENEGKVNYSITDLDGRVIEQSSFTGSEAVLDVSGFRLGLYVIRMEINGEIFTRRLVVM
ncbi:MAG: choice-of-anchor D domain-containing protein [Bacteroidales bacterium]|nr:choice-of-anchor D domain-containing protein [Bacteroidales bacterium]